MSIRSLVLVAAAMSASGVASAADLAHPVKVAVDYVKVCSAYGDGFFYIPGSDTCLQIGGYVRAQYYTGNANFFASETTAGVTTNWYGGPYKQRRDAAAYSTTLRTHLTFDARTNTEYGLLRSFIATRINYDGPIADSVARPAAAVDLDKAYIQWGGLTAGRAQSFFSFYTGSTYQQAFSEVFTDVTTNLLAYTFTFGNGVALSVSLEDASVTGNRNGIVLTGAPTYYNDGAVTALNGMTYGANHVPDVVANLNVTQAWGAAQLSVGLHENYANAANVGSKWGWGVLAGVTINLPTLGEGDVFGLQAAYSVGAIKWANSQAFQAGGSFANIGTDAIIDASNSIRQTKAWAIGAGFTHNFSAKWAFDINGGVYGVDGFRSNDYTAAEVGAELRWKPVKGLEIGGTVEYRNVGFTKATKFAYTNGGVDSLKDSNAWVVGMRVQRDF